MRLIEEESVISVVLSPGSERQVDSSHPYTGRNVDSSPNSERQVDSSDPYTGRNVDSSPNSERQVDSTDPYTGGNVNSSPGSERQVGSSGPFIGRTLKVEAFFSTNHADDKQHLKKIADAVSHLFVSGELLSSVSVALLGLTGMQPDIVNFAVSFKAIAPWSSEKCQSHMTKIVQTFTATYTPRMVPAALFWECTHFVVQLSFSQDSLASESDRNFCQKLTTNFSTEWNAHIASSRPHLSARAKTQALDMSGFCTSVCEVKYGTGAALCK